MSTTEKLTLEINQKLDEVTRLVETVKILCDPEMMKNIREGLGDIEEEGLRRSYAAFLRKSRRAERFWKLKRDARARVGEAPTTLESRPYAGKRLRGELRQNYSMWAGKIRTIYTVSEKDKTVYVIAIRAERNDLPIITC